MQQQRNEFDHNQPTLNHYISVNDQDQSSEPTQNQKRLFYSEKIIPKTTKDNKEFGNAANQNISEKQMMNNLNMSFDGLFSRIEALKEQSTLPDNNPKENHPLQNSKKFPKFSPFPAFKTPKSTLNAKSFDQFFEKIQPFTPKDVSQQSISSFTTKEIPKKKDMSFLKSGLLNIPNLKVSMDVPEQVVVSKGTNLLKLEDIVKKQTEEKFEIMKSCIFEKPLTIQDFQLGKCVGSGKFGDVFVCRHRLTGCFFALKKIFKSTILEYDMVGQFTKQLKIHYQLNHPNVVKLYTHFQDEYHVFLLMEYVEGGILMDKLKSSEEAVSKYVSETIQAAQHLHRLNIAHRDIKPENIVLQFNTVKLCDFGWSTFYGKQMKKTFCGTLDYLSPQMKEGDSYDNSVDIWAIGVLTFQLITGNAPFKKQLASWKGKGFERQFNNSNKWRVIYPPYLSTPAQSFMRNILKQNPNERAPLRACSNHLFIRKYRIPIEEMQYYEEFKAIVE